MAATTFDIHADDGERCHPRVIRNIGLETNGGRSVPVVGQGTVEVRHLIWSDGVAVERVIALHVNGVVGDTADSEVNEIIDVEPFAGDAAVGSEQHAERVGTATEEHLRVTKARDLLPCVLWIP